MKKVKPTFIIIVIFFIVSVIPISPQEKKDIEMDVFEKDGKTLPFYAKDSNNHPVTNLEKKDLILLLNGRNYRNFSLKYPSRRKRSARLAQAPAYSCYDIVFPYTAEFYAGHSIQLGTTRPGVCLYTIDTLKINPPADKSGTPLETAGIETRKTEKQIIQVKIIDVDSQGHQITKEDSPAVQSKQSLGEREEKKESHQPKTLPSDTKTTMLRDIRKFQLSLSDKAGRSFCEGAINYLRRNRVKEALYFFQKLLEREGIPSEQEGDRLPVLELIKKTDRYTENLLFQLTELSKNQKSTIADSTWKKIDALVAKGRIEKALSAMQEVLKHYRVPVNIVREALDKLPVILKVHQYPPYREEKQKTILSPAAQLEYCRNRLDLYSATIEQMESQVFVQPGRIKQIMKQLEQFLSTEFSQLEMLQHRLLNIQNIEGGKYEGKVMDFIIANSSQFPKEFKAPFFKKKLKALGAPEELLEQPAFFQVAIRSRGIRKNPQGYWETRFNHGFTMVYIPAGEFTMGVPWESGGAEDESPQHKVYLDSYWISKYEITFDQYDQFCREAGKGELYDYGRGRKNLPVIGVAWHDCQDFCQWLSIRIGIPFRLPSEAEWEKAARGTKAWKYPWGNNEPDGKLSNFADVRFLKKYLELNPPQNEKERKQKTGWINPAIDDGYVFTAPVGSYPQGASPYGVMDMAGNVWEWVMDWYDDDYYHRSPTRNPQKSRGGIYRIARGGGWDCHPWLLRSTGRAGCNPNQGNDALGFRVVCRYTHNNNSEAEHE